VALDPFVRGLLPVSFFTSWLAASAVHSSP
jgi:hypothetical protein